MGSWLGSSHMMREYRLWPELSLVPFQWRAFSQPNLRDLIISAILVEKQAEFQERVMSAAYELAFWQQLQRGDSGCVDLWAHSCTLKQEMTYTCYHFVHEKPTCTDLTPNDTYWTVTESELSIMGSALCRHWAYSWVKLDPALKWLALEQVHGGSMRTPYSSEAGARESGQAHLLSWE